MWVKRTMVKGMAMAKAMAMGKSIQICHVGSVKSLKIQKKYSPIPEHEQQFNTTTQKRRWIER